MCSCVCVNTPDRSNDTENYYLYITNQTRNTSRWLRLIQMCSSTHQPDVYAEHSIECGLHRNNINEIYSFSNTINIHHRIGLLVCFLAGRTYTLFYSFCPSLRSSSPGINRVICRGALERLMGHSCWLAWLLQFTYICYKLSSKW